MKKKQRIVIKVGTSTLTYDNCKLNIRRLEKLCKVIADLQNQGNEMVLVSSGALAVGMGKLGIKNRPEMIPKPYKRQGGMPYPIRNTPDLSNGAYRADFSRKWHREHTDFAPVPSYPTKPKKGAFFHAENEQEAQGRMGVLPQ